MNVQIHKHGRKQYIYKSKNPTVKASVGFVKVPTYGPIAFL